jgi:hypothetical protein
MLDYLLGLIGYLCALRAHGVRALSPLTSDSGQREGKSGRGREDNVGVGF